MGCIKFGVRLVQWEVRSRYALEEGGCKGGDPDLNETEMATFTSQVQFGTGTHFDLMMEKI